MPSSIVSAGVVMPKVASSPQSHEFSPLPGCGTCSPTRAHELLPSTASRFPLSLFERTHRARFTIDVVVVGLVI